MAAYNDDERRELQQVPVVDVLRAFGFSTAHGRDGLYLSPFRKEKSPSFHISHDGCKWYDFGTGHGGTSLTLVCHLMNCGGGKGYDFLAGISRTFIQAEPTAVIPSREEGPAHIIVTDARRTFRDRSLVSYALSRGIHEQILREWCRELSFTYSGHPKFRETAIGFGNDAGGWILRTPDIKRCTSSDITTIDIYGEHSDSPTSPMGIMFEGFFDFLSFMELCEGGWPKCDICVLNSVTNVRKAQSWIRAHSRICTLFDNDDAGRKAHRQVSDLKAAVSGGPCVMVCDWSDFYKGCNDLNEKLMRDGAERLELTIQFKSLWNKTSQKTFRRD